MSRESNLPFFPIAPQEYNSEYMNRVVQSFSEYMRRIQNPGEGRNTRTVMTNVPTSTAGQEAGMVYNDNTVLRITSGTASENTNGLPVPQYTSATLPAVESGTIIYDSDPDGSYTDGLRVGDGINWNRLAGPYETGNYNVTITPQTSGSITLATSSVFGYVRIGRLVHVQGQIAVASVSSPNGTAHFSLPYVPANVSGNGERCAGSVALQGVAYGSGGHSVMTIVSGTPFGVILTAQSGVNWENLNASLIGAGDDFRVGFSYMTNEDT